MSLRADLEAALERRHAISAARRAIDAEARSQRRIAELQVAQRAFERRAQA